MASHLKALNPEQRRAVKTTEGPVLVLAGAGTGKTRVITVRIGYLMHKGVDPRNILAVTFTNKAAREMRERVAGVVGKKKAELVTIGTFHAFCMRVLRTHGEKIGVAPNFSICDASDQLSAAKAALRDLHVAEAALHPRVLQMEISLMKNRLVTAAECRDKAVDDRDALLGRAYERYEENLRRGRCLDFDDLLLRTLELLRESGPTRSRLRERFRYLLVDEYQDTNGPQYEIVKSLAGKRRNLCVVGDDDQSIYGWRGADVKKILEFERDFPGCEVVRLETNYRSTQPILDAANAVISCNPARHEKTLRSHKGNGQDVRLVVVEDEEAEARGIVADLLKKVTRKTARFEEFAILFRAAVQSRAFEAELRRHDVPYVLVGGQSFFDRKEVRDVLAFLKLAANPDDEVSLLRVINCPPRGIGKTTVARMLEFAAQEGVPLGQAFDRAEDVEGVAPAAVEAARKLRESLAGCAKMTDLVGLVRTVLDAVDYRAEVWRCYPDANAREARWAGVLEMLNFAENHARRVKKPDLPGFLEVLALQATDHEPGERGPRDAVTLMTLHAAKGLEYPFVYLVGAEEGLLPHVKSAAEDRIEEERRLMYVGITRAREHLTISHAKQRAKHGRRVECMPSRFLFEMRGETPPETWRAVGSPERATRAPKRKTGRRRRARA